MITDVFQEKIICGLEIDLLFNEKKCPSFYLDLIKIKEFPQIFYLTGSVADEIFIDERVKSPDNKPNDVDFFASMNLETINFLQELGFKKISKHRENYNVDPFIYEIYRREYNNNSPHIDVQIISSGMMRMKLSLMQDFHKLTREIDMSKAQKKTLIQTLLDGEFRKMVVKFAMKK